MCSAGTRLLSFSIHFPLQRVSNSINIPNIVGMHRFLQYFWMATQKCKVDKRQGCCCCFSILPNPSQNLTIFPTQISLANRSEITIFYCFVCPFINVQAAVYSIYCMYIYLPGSCRYDAINSISNFEQCAEQT